MNLFLDGVRFSMQGRTLMIFFSYLQSWIYLLERVLGYVGFRICDLVVITCAQGHQEEDGSVERGARCFI